MTVLDAFLEADNQTLLWTIIRQTPFFQKAELKDPEIWFQIQMEEMSNQLAAADADADPASFYDKLLNWNQKTLLHMMESLKQWIQSLPVDRQPMSLSNRIDNDTKIRFTTEKDTPLKNLEELVQARLQEEISQNKPI